MSGFAQTMRLIWIDAQVARSGVRRHDICAAFGVSVPQASKDLKVFQDRFPDRLGYDASAKRYIARSAVSAFASEVHEPVMVTAFVVRGLMEIDLLDRRADALAGGAG